MTIDGLIFEMKTRNVDRETATVELPKCTWKEGAENPESTVFLQIKKNGPSDPYYKCLSCVGINYKCGLYLELLREMGTEF